MPAKPKTSGKSKTAKPVAKKAAPSKAAAKPAPTPKGSAKKTTGKSSAAPAKPNQKAVKSAPAKGTPKSVSNTKPAKATKPTPKAPAKKVSKTQAASSSAKPAPGKSTKTASKSPTKAAAPKPKATPAKAPQPKSSTVKKAAPKASSTAKSAPKTKAPATKTAAAPAKAAPKTKTPAAAPAAAEKKSKAKEKPEVVIQEAPPAPKRAKKEAIAPPTTFGKMPRRRIDDEMEVTIEPIKGPVKMTPFLTRQKQRLIELRDSYLNLIEGVANETIRQRPEDGAGSAFGMHQADAGSDAYDRDFALSLLGKEQDALYEINEALKRIEQGVYGICEMSKEKISHERLEALPFTRYTVVCQERIERQQMGGRFARPVRSLFGLDDASETSADASDEDDSDSLDSSRD
jgi:RNA polymerase-binding transcription factor DksA